MVVRPSLCREPFVDDHGAAACCLKVLHHQDNHGYDGLAGTVRWFLYYMHPVSTAERQEFINGLLDQVYAKSEQGRHDASLDIIFDVIDELIEWEQLEMCDTILAAVDCHRLDVASLLGFLSTTSIVKDRLGNRDAYCKRVRHELSQRSIEDLDQLLGVLR